MAQLRAQLQISVMYGVAQPFMKTDANPRSFRLITTQNVSLVLLQVDDQHRYQCDIVFKFKFEVRGIPALMQSQLLASPVGNRKYVANRLCQSNGQISLIDIARSPCAKCCKGDLLTAVG